MACLVNIWDQVFLKCLRSTITDLEIGSIDFCRGEQIGIVWSQCDTVVEKL